MNKKKKKKKKPKKEKKKHIAVLIEYYYLACNTGETVLIHIVLISYFQKWTYVLTGEYEKLAINFNMP